MIKCLYNFTITVHHYENSGDDNNNLYYYHYPSSGPQQTSDNVVEDVVTMYDLSRPAKYQTICSMSAGCQLAIQVKRLEAQA